MKDPIAEHRALLARGQAFIIARREFVESGDALTSLIMAAIANGAVTRDAIIKTVPRSLAHRYPRVALILDEGTSADPSEGCWFRDHDKQYHLHCVPGEAVPAGLPFKESDGLERTLKRKAKPSRKRRANVQHLLDAGIPF